MKQKVVHYPRLDTVLMVEKAIKKASSYPNKRRLWLSLPKKMMYQTFNIIIDYLIESGKILIDNKNRIIWTYNPKLIKRMRVM